MKHFIIEEHFATLIGSATNSKLVSPPIASALCGTP